MAERLTTPDAAQQLYEFVGVMGVHGPDVKPWAERSEEHKQKWRDAVAVVQAALPHLLPTGEGVRVKALVWMQETPYLWIADWNGNDYIVRQMVDGTFQVGNRGAILDLFPSEATAKSAAQSDHETCILSALVLTPPTETVKPEPVAWKTPYFEKLINGSLAPILVWGDLKGGDDWIALYATPPPAADVAELMEATHRLLALCKAGGDPYGEPGKPHVIAVEQALASLRSKGGGK